jgi:hypothetical protein
VVEGVAAATATPVVVVVSNAQELRGIPFAF